MRSALSTSFQKLFVEPINILAFLTLLFIISPKLTAIAILVVPISGAIIFGIARSIRRRAARSQAKLAGITSIIAETLSSIRIVKAFVMKNYELRRFYAQTQKYYELMLRKDRLRLLSSPITETVGNDIENAVNLNHFENHIAFKDVSFHYDESSQEVLKNIDFSIKSGQILALVGPSGAGKSTLVDLIPRFYDVTNGEINIDGKNIKDVKLDSLRSLMGIVTQETFLFDDSVKANIAYGLDSVSDDVIKKAAIAANADEFIEELPEGYDTIIGERGVKLSGGQRQRIAIARAIVKNPPILILDEATSSLDTESEKIVQDAIEKLMHNRTVVVIAHRLSTVHNADKIIVLNKGLIVDTGTHKELINKDGIYKQLHNMQFKT